MPEKKVEFFTGQGLRLAAIMEVPYDVPSGTSQLPGVVLCQGPGGAKGGVLTDVSRRLNEAGFAVLYFDYRGFGESEGRPRIIIPMEQVEDIRCALTWLEQQPEVDPERLGLWGAATGGSHASYVAGIDNRVKCMVSVSGMGDCGRWLRTMRPYWQWRAMLKSLDEDRVRRVLTGKSQWVDRSEVMVPTPAMEEFASKLRERWPQFGKSTEQWSLESADALINYRPEEVVNAIAPRAAMWIHASEDTRVPIEEAQSLYAKAGEPKRLVVFQDLEHHDLYLGEGFEKMIGATIDWFSEHLKR
jgi:hypothetical protein